MTAPPPPAFSHRDPSSASFWDERFAAGFTPWDAGAPAPALLRWLAALGPGNGRRVLVPGCGSGHEVAALDAAGFRVTAIDYAAQAVAQARLVLGEALADRCLQQADFFDGNAAWASARFDLIFERALLAALPPSCWPAWAARVAELLAPGGVLAGLFVIDPAAAAQAPRRGPPFAIAQDELHALLDPYFTLAEVQPVPAAESLPVFAGKEVWMGWQRRPAAATTPMAHAAAGPRS
jgi:protein-L-isoaspartate O-methyltransferase